MPPRGHRVDLDEVRARRERILSYLLTVHRASIQTIVNATGIPYMDVMNALQVLRCREMLVVRIEPGIYAHSLRHPELVPGAEYEDARRES